MSISRSIIKYAEYLRKAKTKYSIHSPFVYDLITNVFNNKTLMPEFSNIEVVRSELLKDKSILMKTDYGASLKVGKTYKTSIKKLASTSLMPADRARMLFRLIRYFKYNNILEIGTALGLTTAYMAKAAKQGQVFTLEGCPEISAKARSVFNKLDLQNIRIFNGEFDQSLPAALEEMESPDLVLFDGNHSKEATLRYYHLCRQNINNNSVFIFDDIHWSEGMEEAWNDIKRSEPARLTIDLFHFGMVFFRKESSIQDFVIRY